MICGVIAVILFVLGSVLTGENEYFLLLPDRGENEITKEVYKEYKNEQEVEKYLSKDWKPNLLIGLGIGSLTLLGLLLYRFPYRLFPSIMEPQDSLNLREHAKFYYEMGFNLTIINGRVNQKNTYQDSYKIPSIEWESHRTTRQSEGYINGQNWERATGIGAISGVSDYVCLDFDNCYDVNFILEFIKENPGMSSSDIASHFLVPPRYISSTLWKFKKEGIVSADRVLVSSDWDGRKCTRRLNHWFINSTVRSLNSGRTS